MGAAGRTAKVATEPKGTSPAAGAAEDAKGLAKGRPAETLTALAGATGAALTQLLDVENAAVISLLIALIGVIPALVTWLVEVGKKWDASVPAPPGEGAEAIGELDYAEARLLRRARITLASTGSRSTEDELARVKSIRGAFVAPKPESGS